MEWRMCEVKKYKEKEDKRVRLKSKTTDLQVRTKRRRGSRIGPQIHRASSRKLYGRLEEKISTIQEYLERKSKHMLIKNASTIRPCHCMEVEKKRTSKKNILK